VETRTESIKTIAELSGVRAHMLYRNYKQVSGFAQWDQLHHATEYMIFAENIGPNLSIDEVSLSKGELYTYVTNKAAKGRKGTLVASIRGTKAADIIDVLQRLPLADRLKVSEVTLDMAKNMEAAVGHVFPNARLVTDRFHVMQLAYEVVQRMRISLRWKEMDRENAAIAEARELGVRYVPEQLVNGDTPKQLLTRSRYVLNKPESRWTNNQWLRAKLVFQRYPELKQGYDHVQKLTTIYKMTDRDKATQALERWIANARNMTSKWFESCARTFENFITSITGFFAQRSTNASAESFNAKVKGFRALQRGVTDTEFFLFRLAKLYG